MLGNVLKRKIRITAHKTLLGVALKRISALISSVRFQILLNEFPNLVQWQINRFWQSLLVKSFVQLFLAPFTKLQRFANEVRP
jgi:hypothetical protein